MNGLPINHGATTEGRPTWVRWQIIGLLVAYSFMSWFNRVSMSVAGNAKIIDQLVISETLMGSIYTGMLLSYAICMTPGGWCIDRWGPWLALVAMGLGSALFVGLTGAVGFALGSGMMLWSGLMLVRVLMGVFTAPIYPASGRIIAHWLPFSQRAFANGLMAASAVVGSACTYFGFGALIDAFGWPAAFIMTGALTALIALLWTCYAKDYPSQHSRVNQAELQTIRADQPKLSPIEELSPGQAAELAMIGVGLEKPSSVQYPRPRWQQLLRNRSLVMLTISYGAIGYVEYLFYFWVERYFNKVLDLGKDQSRLYSTIVMLGMAAGIMLGGRLSDWLVRYYGYRWGRVMVPVAGMIAGAVFVFLGLLATAPMAIVACFTLALAAVGACEGPCWANAIELGGRQGGTSAGIFNTGGNLGGLIAPQLTPWVAAMLIQYELADEQRAWSWAISLGSLICLAGVVLWLWIDPRERVEEPSL